MIRFTGKRVYQCRGPSDRRGKVQNVAVRICHSFTRAHADKIVTMYHQDKEATTPNKAKCKNICSCQIRLFAVHCTVNRIQGYKIRFSSALLLHCWRIKRGYRWKTLFLIKIKPQPCPPSPSPQPKRTDYNLRQRTHNLTLPTDGNPVMKQNFVYRMVFKDT